MDYPNDQAPGAPIRSGIPEHGRIPKCYAVKARIAVLLDELGEGGLLPTERELAQRHEVSRETVRQALRELHGHTDSGGHGGSAIEERRTFVLAQSPGIAAGARPTDTRLVDVAATVFHQLGITPDPARGLDGKPIQERSTDPFS